jgi:4-hydroxy-tetrahydrodipicolinate reductase
MMKIGIFGGQGRMGRAIAAAAPELGAGIAGSTGRGDDPAPLASAADVLIDFSTAAALDANLAAVRAAGKPIVIGTTGLSPEQQARIDAAARDVAVLQTGNTSLGVALLARLVREAAAALGPDWDVEIVEMHHRNKLDAPSGTALMLGRAAAEGLGVDFGQAKALDRNGKRMPGSIGFASLRGGGVIGDHHVILAGPGERIELTHRAEDRSLFAIGAVKAALWLVHQPPGRYTMAQVLGL